MPQWQKPFCLALHQPAIAFTIAPCPAWISSIEVLIKGPHAGYHAALLRLVSSIRPSSSINSSFFWPIPHKLCLLTLSHPRRMPLGIIWRTTTRNHTNEKKQKW